MLPINKKEWTTNIHNNLDESPGNHAEWKKPIPEGHLLYDSSYVTWHNILQLISIEMENKLEIARG